MAKSKVAVTLDSETLRRVDRLVRDARCPNRSRAIEAAIAEQLDRRLTPASVIARADRVIE